jgi:Spy/CpxP family protein refolding chaperone
MNSRVKLIRNAAFGALAGAGLLLAYEIPALSQNDPAESSQDPMHRHWGEHGGAMGRHGGGFGLGFDGGFGPALKQLDLTDGQQKSVRDILTQARPEMQKMHEQMHNLVETFRRTLPDDPKYSSVVAQTTRDSQQLAASMVRQVSDLRTKIYAVLTPEQKARLPGLMKNMEERHKMHHDGAQPEDQHS